MLSIANLDSNAMKHIKKLFPSPYVGEAEKEVEIAIVKVEDNLSFEEQLKAKLEKFVTHKPLNMTLSQAQKNLKN